MQTIKAKRKKVNEDKILVAKSATTGSTGPLRESFLILSTLPVVADLGRD